MIKCMLKEWFQLVMRMKKDNRILSEDFRVFLECLISNNVKYLIVGGYALGAYGYARATNDLDIYIDTSEENVSKLIRACIEFGIPESQLTKDIFVSERVIKIGEEPLKIELIKHLSRFSFEEAYNQKSTRIIDGIEVTLLGIDHLILTKKTAARSQDLVDVEVLEKIRNKSK